MNLSQKKFWKSKIDKSEVFEPQQRLRFIVYLEGKKFKILAQENIEVCLFEEMTNASALSEKKPPLVALPWSHKWRKNIT